MPSLKAIPVILVCLSAAACVDDRSAAPGLPLTCGVGANFDFSVESHWISVAGVGRGGFGIILNKEYANDRAEVLFVRGAGWSDSPPTRLDFNGADAHAVSGGRLFAVQYEGTDTAVLDKDGVILSAVSGMEPKPVPLVASDGSLDWIVWADAEWTGETYLMTINYGEAVDGHLVPLGTLPSGDHPDSAAAVSSTLMVALRENCVAGGPCTSTGLYLLTRSDGVDSVADLGFREDAKGGEAQMAKVLATNSGYAVLWRRWPTGDYRPEAIENFLNFHALDGTKLKTVGVPYMTDIVWNGREFGGIGPEDGKRLLLHRLDADGRVMESGIVADASDTEELGVQPYIHASGSSYAVDWWIWDKKGAEPENHPLLTIVNCP